MSFPEIPSLTKDQLRQRYPLFSMELVPLILRLKEPRIGSVLGYGDKHEGNLRLCVEKKSVYTFHWGWLCIDDRTQRRIRAMLNNNELAAVATMNPNDILRFWLMDAGRPRALTSKELPEKPSSQHESLHLPGIAV